MQVMHSKKQKKKASMVSLQITHTISFVLTVQEKANEENLGDESTAEDSRADGSASNVYQFEEATALSYMSQTSLELLDVVDTYRIPRESHDKIVKLFNRTVEKFASGKIKKMSKPSLR